MELLQGWWKSWSVYLVEKIEYLLNTYTGEELFYMLLSLILFA